ncbi:MAG: hypothetical protein M3Q23_07065 [Actinomycetota bacterium]|nr:hypothetical protein [Actinomycetota bacterium]
MSGLIWVIVALVVVLAVAAIVWRLASKRRTGQLKEAFGPEYERSKAEAGSRRKAESELAARQTRREGLDIRPLAPEARDRYSASWVQVQGRFVDEPGVAVTEADRLVSAVMRDRGYPMDDFDQRSADISVDLPHVVEDYRAAHAISMANDHGKASTEDLRQAFVHYRSLFDELLVVPDDAARPPEVAG